MDNNEFRRRIQVTEYGTTAETSPEFAAAIASGWVTAVSINPSANYYCDSCGTYGATLHPVDGNLFCRRCITDPETVES